MITPKQICLRGLRFRGMGPGNHRLHRLDLEVVRKDRQAIVDNRAEVSKLRYGAMCHHRNWAPRIKKTHVYKSKNTQRDNVSAKYTCNSFVAMRRLKRYSEAKRRTHAA